MRSDNKEALQVQLEVLDILGNCGNDYLFLGDVEAERLYFFGDIDKRYPVLLDENNSCSIEAWYSVICEKDRPALEQAFQRVLRGEATWHNQEYRLTDRDGNLVWVNCRGRYKLDEQGKAKYFIGRISDTAMEPKVDQLTGLFNSAKLGEDVERILKVGLSGFLMLMGVDNLKHINLQYGREYGSRILCRIADTLEELVGNGLRIYRANGDCFAVNLPEFDQSQVEQLYQQLQQAMAEYCTLSAGAVSYQGHDKADGGVIYQCAEDTLDRAKSLGKNNLAFFSQKDYEQTLSTVKLQEELYRSVQEGFKGFSIYYQPQVRSRSYALFGMEALLRYCSPTRGTVSPVEFIPVLEQTGMICQVGLWVLEQALRQCRIWRSQQKNLHISVNMSYIQLKQEDIVHQVLERLQQSGLPGDALTLEITESMQLQNYPHFNKLLYRWKRAGIEISVDDFGTGYSSLGYLKNLDIDEIKIDRCFVRGIQHSAYNYRLLSNMVELARGEQIRVCCEGVEDREELAALEALGPDLMQGFLFNRPMSCEEFEKHYFHAPASGNQNDSNSLEEEFSIGKSAEEPWPTQRSGKLNLRYQDVLKDTDVGLWILSFDPKNDQKELFPDETMCRILGIERDVTPEECYQHWYKRIHDGYYQYVERAVKRMIRSGRVVQLEYPWHHPVQGEVMVRCMGIRDMGEKEKICLKGYYRIISDVERPQFLPEAADGEIFEFNERKGTIYFHTGRTLLAGTAVHESDFPNCWLKTNMVHPHFVETFANLFRDVGSAANVMGQEILLRSKKGNYDWFRLSTHHLSREAKDRDTILVRLDAANEMRRLQLENMRIRDFYHTSLGEAIAYAEIDLEGTELKDSGGLWRSYTEEYGNSRESLLQFMMRQAEEEVRPNQNIEIMRRAGAWVELLNQADPIQRYRYQRKVEGEWRWVELVIHGFREQFTANQYALIYLKDIEAQVRKEQAQRKAADQDPLTGVYNRKAFETAVLEYLSDDTEERQGALILLDVDNFKTINDCRGHQAGDDALCYVTKQMREIFRQGDLVGRLGGDEFIVFLKGRVSRQILSQRMDQLYGKLSGYPDFPITCSAGIVFVTGKDFCYQQSVFQADMALYRSKQAGKCHYSYAEP